MRSGQRRKGIRMRRPRQTHAELNLVLLSFFSITQIITYIQFAILCFVVLSLIDFLWSKLYDHGQGWSGYRCSNVIRFEDTRDKIELMHEEHLRRLEKQGRFKEYTRLLSDGPPYINPADCGGRKPLGPPKSMIKLTRYMRDTSVWDDEDTHNGLNKT